MRIFCAFFNNLICYYFAIFYMIIYFQICKKRVFYNSVSIFTSAIHRIVIVFAKIMTRNYLSITFLLFEKKEKKKMYNKLYVRA